ncbi:hypothetical protein D3C80_1907180 [compost metagenome]
MAIGSAGGLVAVVFGFFGGRAVEADANVFADCFLFFVGFSSGDCSITDAGI